MNLNLKRILSFALAFVMIVGMLPANALSVWAADDETSTIATDYEVGATVTNKGNNAKPTGTIPTGSHWEGPVKSADVTCGKIEHPEHTAECYDKVLNCEHSHVQACYTSFKRCYSAGIGCSHEFHYKERSGLFGTKYYGSSTIGNCTHGDHVPYGQPNSCYKLGELSRTGCPTLDLLSNWTPYTHTHTEPECYDYTWTLKWDTHKVTWNWKDARGDNATKVEENVNYGTALTAPEVPEIIVVGATTYTFKGWDSQDAGNEPDTDLKVTGNMTYTAVYSSETLYSVTFNTDGGSNVNTQKIEKDKTATKPENPTKAGFMFVKWVDANDNEFDFATKITADVALKAVWAPDTNNNGINDETETIKVIINENGEVKLTDGKNNVINATNVTAVYDSTSGKVTVVATPASGYYVDVTVNNGAVLEGSWKNTDIDSGWLSSDYRNVYTGSFAVEPGKSYEVTVVNTKYEWSLPKDAVIVSLNGYLFNGITSVPKAEILKAIYGEDVNADMYDGAVDEGWGSVTIKLGEPFQYKVTLKATDKYPAVSDTIMVTASDNRSSVEITHNYVNGSSFNTEDDFKSYFANNCIKVNGNVVDLEVLLNWNGKIEWTKNDDGTYTAVVTLNESKDWLTSTATFSGLTWAVSKYAIEFKDHDGSVILAAKNYPYGTLAGDIQVPADPTRTGYTFTGWNPVVSDVKGTVTYVATYEINTYTVTWTVNGETITTTDVEYDEAITAPVYTTPEGHTFHGWQNIPATMPAENITLNASLTVNTYYITWVVEGVETTIGYEYNTSVTKENPVKEGWGFVGWYDEAGNRVELATFKMPVAENGIKLTAKFFQAAAMIGETPYQSFDEAMAAAKDGDTVLLLKDATIDKKYVINGNVTISGQFTITRADSYTGTLFEVKSGATLTLDGNLTIDGGNNYAFDKDAYMVDVMSRVRIAKEDCRKWFTLEEGAPIATAFMITTTGGTINLNNVTIQNNYSVNSGIISAGANSTINLTGAKIHHVACEQNSGVVANVSGANILVTINEGTVIDGNHVGGNHGLFKIYSGAKVVMNGGEITNTTGWNSNGVVAGLYGSATVNGEMQRSSFIMNGGKICSNSSVNGPSNGRNAVIYGHSQHYFLMTGGTICHNIGGYAGLDAPHTNGVAQITGGAIVNNISASGNSRPDVNGSTNLTISGGTFTQDVNEWCTEDFKAELRPDGTWGVREKKEFNVTFEGIGSVTVTEDDLVAVPESNPTKDQAIFGGWDFDFTTPITESITINAIWISDLNRNNVPDANETITIVVTGNGTVGGDIISIGDGKYVFDSTKATVEVVVTPVVNDGISASYVVSINGAALTYGEGFKATANLTVKNGDVIEIDLVDVPLINGDKVVVDYNFFTKVIPYGNIYNSVIKAPVYKDGAVKYTYFARPAMKHTVSIDSLDLDSSIKTLLNTIGITEFSFDMEELWLPLDAQIEESVDLETAVSTYLTKERINGLLDIYNAAHDAAYGPAYDKAYQEYVDRLGTTFGADTAAKGAAEVAAIAAGGKAVKDDIQVIYDVVYASAKYYGAHNFGYNATGADTVDELIRIEYTDESMHWTTDATVTLKDPRESAFISGSDLTLTYRDYTDEELLAMFGLVDANGNPIEGAVYSVQLSDPYTFEGKNVSETVYELTVKFAGNENYKAAEKTFTITIVKATASIDVPNVNATFGDLLPGIDVTMGNKYGDKQEIIDSLVQIIIGLDLDELEITPDGKLEGIGTRIQIMLPKDDTLATIFKTLGLDVYGEEGVTLSLGELQGYLDQLDGLLGSFDSGSEMVDGITNILQSVTGLVDLSNVEITFGGKYPTDMGVYVYGVVSTSGNYETAYDVGYIVIKPDTTKVYLDWNKPITNSVLNLEALKNFDLGATAFDDELFANLNAEATKLIINLYLGIDLNGKTYLTADPTSLGNGAYIEIAFIYDIGNEMYYAVPIVRPIVVAPDMVDVELKDQYGNTTNDMVVDFNNKGQSFDIFINGELANDNDFLTVYYIGVQSNGQFYHSTEKPVHAGVYTAIAVYAEYMNEDGELTIMNIEDIINGIIDGLDIENIDIDQILATLQSDLDGLESFGINAGVITILPVESNVTVEDKVEIVDPNKQNRPVDQVIVGSSADANLRPDSTIISAGIASNGTFTENGWSAVNGNVNIDFPAWVDAILAEYVPGIADGITVAELSDMLTAKLPAILAVLEEKGASNEVLNSLTNAINNVLKVLDEIPDNTTLTFESDIAYTNVGAYVIVAIVTDSDHIPSIDAGFLVIRPNVTNVELEWNYEDDNNLFTRDLLEAIDYDLWAKALANGVFDKDATAKITYQFIGVNADGEFVIYTDPTSMPNGAYIQLAYIAFELDGQMYISDMIARPVVIAPSSCKVEVDELHTEFDNTNKDVTVTITDLEGNVIDITKGELTFVYAGLQANGQPYLSATAPKHAGVYEVIVVYVEYDENGAMRYYGAGVGGLVIDLTDSTIDVTGGNEEYNGNGHTATVIPGSTVSGLKPDFTLISGGVWYVGDINAVGLSDLRGNVNIDFPKWFDAVIAEYEFADGINPAYLTRFINAYRADMIAQVEEAVDKLGANVAVDQLNAYIDELLAVLARLPSDAALYFNDNMSYSEVGYYFYYGIITDSDHKPSTDTGVLVIEPTDISDIEATDTVYNGYEQTTTLTVIGANGAVLTEGIDFVIVSGNKATNAGTYTVTIQGIGNYTGEYTVEWTIEKAKVTATVNDATKVYGENDPIFSAVISGLKINDTLNVSFQRVEGENVGEYVISAYASDDNYDITFVTGKLTITKASVVVDVNDATKVYGSADPAFTAQVSGLKFNDQLNITFTREEGENVGKYVITASASDANYDITFVSGELTITKKAATITVNDKNMVAGNTVPTLDAIVSGVIDGDTLNYTVSCDYVSEIGKHGSYDIVVTLGNNPNYDVTVDNGTLTVEKCVVTIDGVAYSSFTDAHAFLNNNVAHNIKLYADIYASTTDVIFYTWKNNEGSTELTFDLNGYDFYVKSVTAKSGMKVNIIDSTADNEGSFKIVGTILGEAKNTITIENGVKFDGTIQMNNTKANPGTIILGNEVFVGTNGIFSIDQDYTAYLHLGLNHPEMNITLGVGQLTLNCDYTIEDNQKFTIGASGVINIPAGVTLTIENGAEFSILTNKNGSGNIIGEGTVKVGTQEHLDLILTMTEIKNVAIAEGIVINNYTLGRADVNYTGATNLIGTGVEITAGTFDANVYANCADGYYAKDNGNGTWTVVKKIAVGNVVVNSNLIYNGTAQVPEITVYDVNGNVIDPSNYSITVTAQTNAGKYDLTVKALDANIAFIGEVEATWTIAKKAATITVNGKNMVAGNTVPTLDAIVSGVIDGETLDYNLTVDADGKTAGTYTIVVNLGNNPNYDVTVVNGTLTVEVAIAQNKETGIYYAKLQDAIDEVKDGETIVFLTNIDEDVTITQKVNVAFTIDGANYKYFGTMYVYGTGKTSAQGQALTVQNIHFVVDGHGISANVKKSYARNITVDSCTFTGEGYNDYGVTLYQVYDIVVKNTTASGMLDLVYGRGSITNLTIDSVEVINSTNGFYLAYVAGTAIFKNVNTSVNNNGVLIRNNATGTVYFEECSIDNIKYYSTENNEHSVTMNFVDTTNKLDINGAHDKLTIVLNKVDTTVTAIEGLNAKSGVPGYKVVYENGVYFLKVIDYVAQVGEKKFETLQAAIDAAETGETVILLKDIDFTEADLVEHAPYKTLAYVVGKNITLDMNGKQISLIHEDKFSNGYIVSLFLVDKNSGLTVIGNGTIDIDAHDTDPDVVYMFFARDNGTLTIENGTFHADNLADSMIYTHGNKTVVINGGTYILDMTGTQINGNGCPWIFNTSGRNEKAIVVNAGTFNTDVDSQYWKHEVEVQEGYCAQTSDGLTWTIKPHKHTATVTDPTCTEGGYTTYTCDCGDTYTANETVALGHTVVIVPGKAPTCTETGLTDGEHCSVCGEVLVAQKVIPVLGAVAYNTVSGIYYADVSDALAAAQSGETVVLLVDGQIEDMLWVKAGVTFNLNGHTIIVAMLDTNGNKIAEGNVISFGHVIDNDGTTDGLGGIIISNDRTKAFVQLQQNNTYLPLYDAQNGCYRFYYYELSVLKHEVKYENTVTFRARLRLSSAEAYKLLADTANSGVEISVQMEIKGSTKTSYVNYVLTGEFLAEYAQSAYDQVCSGEKTPMKMSKTLDLTLTGLDSVESGTVLTIIPIVTSETGVSFEKNVVHEEYTVYIIP